MATSNEDALDELYAWDSRIDEMYERGVGHAEFDEDDALEAYEEIIQVGAAASAASADAVLSLAAQLLTKHFDKFPHVNLNVVDVLLGLCEASRPQAVRIHSVRSLLQIVKNGGVQTAAPLALACRERIADVGAKLLQAETSNVLVRHLTQLQEAVVKLNDAVTKQEKKEMWAEKREQAKLKKQEQKKEKQEKAAVEKQEKVVQQKQEKQEKQEKHVEERSKVAEDNGRGRTKDQVKRDDPEKRNGGDASTPRGETRDGDRRRENNSRETVERRPLSQQASDKRQDRRSVEDDRSRNREKRADSGSNAANNTRERGTNGCPPSAYIFVGGLPRDTVSRDIINYLSCIDESIDHSCVQIKIPNHGSRNAAGYAFVSLESTDHARKAIRHIQTTEYNGRKLIGDFARGPPCATLQFVERNTERRTHEADAFPLVDFETLAPNVWEELTATLKRYGPFETVRLGCVRFRDVDSAKEVTRIPYIRVQGHDFLPVYDPQEQAEIDSSKRRPRSSSGAEADRERRGGDLSRYGGRQGDRRVVDRRDSRDFNRRSPLADSHNDRSRRSSSPNGHGDRFKGDRQQQLDRRHSSQYSDFDQSRYGPRADAAADKANTRETRGRSPAPVARHAFKDSSPRRSRSRSPLQRTEDISKRGRSRSPVRRKPSEEDSRRTNESTSRDGTTQISSRGRDAGWNSSPPRGRRNSPPRHGSQEQFRQRSPVSRREMFEKKYGRPNNDKASSPPRGRSRSPRRTMSPRSTREGSHRAEGSQRGDAKNSRSRSQSPHQNSNNRDQPTPSRATSSVQEATDVRRYDDERQETMKQPRNEREFESDRRRGRREETPQRMSKYGTVQGSARSPPGARTHAERSRSRDSNRFASDRPEGRLQRHGSPIVESPHRGNAVDKRDRRMSPPRFRSDDGYERGRSPPRSPRMSMSQGRSSGRNSPAHGRSPPRVTGQKRERSRSLQRRQGPGHDEHRVRGGVPDTRYSVRDKEQRQPNRASSPDRRHSKTEERARDADKRDRDSNRTKADPPRKEVRDSARGQTSRPQKEEHSKRDQSDTKRRSPPPSPLLREKRKRSESPVSSTRANKSSSVPVVIEAKAKHDPPRAVTQSNKTTSIYDIDECMVDYEEDED